MTGPTTRCLTPPLAGASPFVGDPVDIVSGALVDFETDFRLPGAPVSLLWVRRYDTRHAHEDRGVGLGFRHALDHTLRFDVDGMTYVDPAWSETAFPFLEHDGATALRQTLLLTRVSEQRYVLEHPNGRRYEFGFVTFTEPGRLLYVRIGERAIELQYDGTRPRLMGVSLGTLGSLQLEWEKNQLSCVVLSEHEPAKRSDLVNYSYDTQGRLVEVEDAYKHSLRYGFDAAHRMVKKTDRRGFAFLFTYDNQGRCVHSRGEDGADEVRLEYRPIERTTIVTRHDGGKWQYLYNAGGAITHIVDPYLGTRVFALDSTGRVAEEIDPFGNASRIVYDARDLAVAKIDPLGHVQALPEDIRLPHPLKHREGTSPLEWEHGMLFDPPARLPSADAGLVTIPAHARSAIQTGNVSWGGRTRMQRTVQGLPLREEREDGKTRRWAFDESANVRWELDFDGNKRSYEYTSAGHLSREVDALGHVTQYEHSPAEQITAVTDPGGTRTEYQLDHKDRVVEVRRHGKVRERYEYDFADNLVAKRDGRGAPLLDMTIGPANRKLARTLASGEAQRFEHDEHGRMTLAEGAAGACTFTYTRNGQRSSDKRDGLGVAHATDGVSDRSTTLFDKFVTRYRRLSATTWLLIDPTGQTHALRRIDEGVVIREFANGWNELSQFDVQGRCLSKVLHRRDDRDRRWERVFRYSGEGDLLERRDSRYGTVQYSYDSAHRLQHVRKADGQQDDYVYDAADNLLSMPGLREGFVTAPTAAAAAYYQANTGVVALQGGNRLFRANGELFHYDDRDHVIAREKPNGVTYYLRDSLDRLIKVDTSGLEWRAQYDPLGRRTEKTVNGKTWQYYWDTDRLAVEIAPEGGLRVYVYADRHAIVPCLFIDYASVDADPASGKRYCVVTNHLGATELVLDDAGLAVWRATLQPYGAAEIETGPEFHQPLRFPGHFYDAETRLHYNRFRYYDPALGRYLESDPKGLEGGLNLYAYTRNPLREVDLRGLDRCPNGKDCPQRKRGTDEDGADQEGKPVRTVSDPEPGKTLSDGSPMPPGTQKITYSDGTTTATYYVDAQGRTIRAETPLAPPANYTKEGVSHILPDGYQPGVDHRGHLGPERGAPNQDLVNVPENVVAEHGRKSNLSAKKQWENGAIEHGNDNPNASLTTVHEPVYEGDNGRPTSVHHELHQDGKPVKGFTRDIPNPTS